jgi:molybdenum cofactor guanylyltransferase
VAAALVVAGGAGRRMGADKPALNVAGRTLLERVLEALPVRTDVVVVGPARTVERAVRFTREEPPGGGPAAAVVAGIAELAALPGFALVAVLAADLPGLTPTTVGRLAAAVGTRAVDTDGAVLVDADGREQLLTGVWRLASLRRAMVARPSWAGASVRTLLSVLARVQVRAIGAEAVDLDTPEQLRAWNDRGQP